MEMTEENDRLLGNMKLQSEISPLERLTLLQDELGYKKGELSTVAMLGLVGEAGEVLNEVGFSINKEQFEEAKKLLNITSQHRCTSII